MTDSQRLLAEYAKSGSESAFRELATRYFGLVYSTALRLVGGDTHLAEDVAQTVFSDLARKAQALSSGVMLGGWLHQRTYNVAAPMMRAQRRRQSREREAAQMNALQDDPGADLAQVAPVLDEAIMSLGTEDRTAIMLCFFERRDFRSIGQALGSSEDAARMRVTRALDKLHTLLTHRGVTLSAAALGTALATEAVTAAPAGLAGSVAATALASAAAAGGATATLVKLMTMTKIKVGILSVIAVAGVATPLAIQYQSQARLREENQGLRQQVSQVDQVAAENEHLSNLVAQAKSTESLSREQMGELLRLRGEVGRLRQQGKELEALQAENRQLRTRLAGAPGVGVTREAQGLLTGAQAPPISEWVKVKISGSGEIFVNKKQVSLAEFAAECQRLKKAGGAAVVYTGDGDHALSPVQVEATRKLQEAEVPMKLARKESELDGPDPF